MSIDRASAENLVGTKISNIDLYQKAFTHKSALKEDDTLNGSFETLEFIGDRTGLVITKFYTINTKTGRRAFNESTNKARAWRNTRWYCL